MKLSITTPLSISLLVLALVRAGCQSSGDETAGSAPAEGDRAGNQAAGDMAPPQGGDSLAQAANEKQRQGVLVRNLLDKADGAANAGRHAEAKDLYRQALDYESSNVEAARGYEAMVRLLSGSSADPGTFEGRVAKQQEVQVKANHHFKRGLELRSENRLDEAVTELERSYQLLQFNPSPLEQDLNANFVKRVLDETAEIKDRADRTKEQRERGEIASLQREEEDRERKALERRVRALWDNLIDRFEAEQFDRAERIADEIIKLDYTDQQARRVKEAARRARHALARESNIESYREEWQRTMEEIKISGIVPSARYGFPDVEKWKQITDRGPIRFGRGEALEISEADRAVRQKLANTVLPRVDWNGKTLADVVDELRAQTNLNILPTPEARNAAEDAGELGLEFTQVTAENALAQACAQLGVAYSVQNGLVRIQTPSESAQNKVVEFYDVRDLVSPIQSFPGVQLNLNASGVGLDGGLEDESDDEPNQAIEMDRLIELVKSAVDPAWDEDEGNRLDPKNGVLIVRQTPAKHRLVSRLLADLRKNTGIQVSIEARFITVENNFLQDIGVDLRGLGDDSGGIGVPGPGTDRTFDDFGVPNLNNNFGGGLNQDVGVGNTSNPVGIGSGNDSGVFFSDRNGNTDVRTRTENLFDEVLGNQNVLDNSGGFSLQFAYLDDVQLEAILRATQKYERINTVTAPNLLVYNTQRANLMVLNEVSYVKDYDVEIAQAAVIADPIIDKVREGVVLDVRPIVSHDRRYVTLELRPTVATLVRPIRTFTTNLAVGSAVTIQLPELQKQTVNTTVVVPDGGTLLLGGMKFAEEKTLDSGVPILKDVPILSFFFSRKGKYTNLRDLIILLKVQIVMLDELEPGARDDVELR